MCCIDLLLYHFAAAIYRTADILPLNHFSSLHCNIDANFSFFILPFSLPLLLTGSFFRTFCAAIIPPVCPFALLIPRRKQKTRLSHICTQPNSLSHYSTLLRVRFVWCRNKTNKFILAPPQLFCIHFSTQFTLILAIKSF